MKPTKLSFHLIQLDTEWKNPSRNCEIAEVIISKQPEADIHILPETFNTGFAIDKSLAEDMRGPTVHWMLQTAKKNQAVICGSLIIKEAGKTFNRFVWAQEDGLITYYDKRHLFSLAKEESQFDKGDKQVIIHYKGWNIRPLVCYDLRFPVWSRNHQNTDVMLYVANWPKPRIYAWTTLLRARAIENQCFVVGVNRVGKDRSGMDYTGQSAAISAMGEEITSMTEKEHSAIAEINYKDLERIREKINFQKDQDSFTIS